ncbi:LysR substrate-binding domain-containing protein [Primorskyibacter sp. S187A]|uniref:hydrogen peroxide-inducible genes activator n=1 Tax=Primorskyibacter sp. S187A TaxID=3415130 RepID=UPI003C7A7F3E
MNSLTLKQLRYFEALARQGHFGRAADICSVSQPALSVQIKDLEATLGAALFERGPRHVSLTRFGEDFAKRVRHILQAVDELGDLARAAQGPLSGKLRLGVIPTIAPYLLPRVLKRLSDSHQGLDVLVRETITPRLISELQAGRLDAAIVALPISEPTLVETPLGREDFVLVRPASHSDPTAPTPALLARERLLLLEEGHCFRDQALSFCGLPGDARGDARSDAMDGSSLATLVQMVSAGLGVTLIPDMAIPVETRRADVQVARFASPAPSREIGLVWRRTSPLEAQLSGVADILRSELAAD